MEPYCENKNTLSFESESKSSKRIRTFYSDGRATSQLYQMFTIKIHSKMCKKRNMTRNVLQ